MVTCESRVISASRRKSAGVTEGNKAHGFASITRKEIKPMNDQEIESEFYTLTDEDGNETEFEVIGSAEINGTEYFAMVPSDASASDDGMIEYVLLKKEKDENGEEMFVTIDDDDEFDSVADYFDDMFDSEEDYDN